MGMVSVWYRHEGQEDEVVPLDSEMDYEITTLEELLDILNVKREAEK